MSTDHIKQIDRAIHALPHDHPAPLQYLTIAVSLSEIQRTSTTAATEATESNGADDDVDAQGCLSDTAFLELCIKRIEDILRQRQTDAYILIILASTGQAEAGQSRLIAGGTAERQMPGLGWWFWNIGRIPHALRKGMKRMVRPYSMQLWKSRDAVGGRRQSGGQGYTIIDMPVHRASIELYQKYAMLSLSLLVHWDYSTML